MDSKDRFVQLQVDHWNMKPGQNGITLVVDQQYAITVYDVSKPISLESFIPLMPGQHGPLGDCYWHELLAFATPRKTMPVAAINPSFPKSGHPEPGNTAQLMRMEWVVASDRPLSQCTPSVTANLSLDAASPEDEQPWATPHGIVEILAKDIPSLSLICRQPELTQMEASRVPASFASTRATPKAPTAKRVRARATSRCADRLSACRDVWAWRWGRSACGPRRFAGSGSPPVRSR